MIRRAIDVVAVLALTTVPALAQDAARQTAIAVMPNASEAITLDGDLNDPAWVYATPITTFLQREPSEGDPATFRTEARVVFDSSAIYVAVRAFDPEPQRIIGLLTRRDSESSSDWVQVFIDSYHDRRTAYQFGVNPAGVKQDAYWFNDGQSDDSWDAVWDVVSKRLDDGWAAEFRIPFSQLRFRSHGDGRVGFAVVRTVARLNETSSWPLLSKGASGFVSSFGDLAGVTPGAALKRLELAPYVVGEVATKPVEAGNPFQRTPDPGAKAGLDLKYAVTPALNLTATVNPDFGQVEADPAVVNLSAFETFFSEKRPFFIEGSGTYQFDCRDCSLFYTRRIGRAPRGVPLVAPGGYTFQPAESTILGAGKLTGRVRDFSVGVLTAVTQEERADIALGTDRWREVIEPGTLYSVSRARREFSDQSSVGFILTTTNRKLTESVSFLPESAVTGGVDYDWRLGRRWGLTGYWAGSTVSGTPEAITRLQLSTVHSFQRPDATHVELDPLAESLRGHSGMVAFGKLAGDRTRGNVNVGYKSPGFDVNDLGFQQRADEIPESSWFQIRWNTPGKYKRSLNLNFNQWSAFNFDGDRLDLGGNVNAHWQFQNLWTTDLGVNVSARRFDDRLTRGGPGGYEEPAFSSWQSMSTNDRRVVSFNWNSAFGGNVAGGRFFELGPGVVIRPTPSLSTELGLFYNRNVEDAQWVREVRDAGETHYVFGRLEQETSSITLRVNYTMTPNLSLQVYAQPFTSSGDYLNYKELVDGRAEDYDQRYAAYDYRGDADFKVLSFRTTNVLRWEYKRGSALFVVWQQAREDVGVPGPFGFSRDYGHTLSAPASSTLLVKLAYWLNP
ncbi:MAG TPA: DUF5916 domain-containing protein [Vicinamibacterales bacterium]|nr:DUF5916 domain-containing protein [Vicinamibacterales bacterium]